MPPALDHSGKGLDDLSMGEAKTDGRAEALKRKFDKEYEEYLEKYTPKYISDLRGKWRHKKEYADGLIRLHEEYLQNGEPGRTLETSLRFMCSLGMKIARGIIEEYGGDTKDSLFYRKYIRECDDVISGWLDFMEEREKG